jgi:hypothetical protein
MMTKRRRVLAVVAIVVSAGLLALGGWAYADRGVGMGLRQHARAVLAHHDAGGGGVLPPSGAALGSLGVDSATTTKTSTELVVTFTGARDPGSEPCGMDYDAEAIESATAVVVVVAGRPDGLLERFNISLGTESCDLVGYPRTATVTLKRPLGDRPVLEVQDGQPVRVTIEP